MIVVVVKRIAFVFCFFRYREIEITIAVRIRIFGSVAIEINFERNVKIGF